jgi:ribosome-binding protein aMBF1 (putative translation factor)
MKQEPRVENRSVRRLTDRWKQNPEYKAAYDALDGEFALAKEMILARTGAHLTQTQLAEKMGTSQGKISKWESGTDSPTVETLRRLADATGTELIVKFKRPRKSAKVMAPA